LEFINSFPAACILLDQESSIEFINREAELIFEYSLEEARGRHPVDLLMPAEGRGSLAALIDHSGNEKTRSRVMPNRTKSGKGLTCIWRAKSLRGEDGEWRGTLVVIQDISNEKKIEIELKRQVERQRALRSIDMAISGSTDIQIVLNVVLQEAMNQLKMSAAALLVYDPVANLLKYAAGRGLLTDALQFTALRLGEGFAGRAVLEKRIVRVPHLNLEMTGFLRSPKFKSEGFKSYYCVPLLSKGKVVGALESFHRDDFMPGRDWMGFFETLGGQAAIAIESARLFFDLQRSNLDLALAHDATLEGWLRALDLRERGAKNRARRLVELTERLAAALKVSEEERVHIRRGVVIHDIGKLGVPDGILHKEGSLTEDEWAIIRQRPEMALKILEPIPFLKPALDIPYYRHEKWDGSGYPNGLSGDNIPLAARIFAVVDVFDALTSDRPYRRAWSIPQALEYLQNAKSKHFDPVVVDVFMRVISNIVP